MSQCTDRFLPLCSIPARMLRDGYGGANAHIYLPFYGFFFASGDNYTFPGSTVPQNQSRFIGGVSKPGNGFHKEGAYCG